MNERGARPRLISTPLLAQLAGGAAALVLGAFPVLAGLGLIETEGGIEPFAAALVVLFGLVFMTIGAVLLGHPMLELARRHGAVTRKDALRLGLRHFLRRPTAASAATALGLAPIAVGCWLGTAGVMIDWLGGADGLRALVLIEFLVIHGFPFLVMAALFMRGTRGRGRLVPGAALALLGLLYSAFAWKAAGGVGGVVALLYLVAPNVLAFATAGSSVSGRVLVISRWVIKTPLFLLPIAMLDAGSFRGGETILAGAVYFTLLACVELFRVVEIPGELASAA